MFTCELQLSEAKRHKTECEDMNKRIIENLKYQTAELNVAYNNAIMMLNERKKELAEVLTQSAEENKNKLKVFQTNVDGKTEKMKDNVEVLKELANRLRQVPYEEIYKAIIKAKITSKLFADGALPEVLCGCFKNSIDLNELGKIHYTRLEVLKKTIKRKLGLSNIVLREEKDNNMEKLLVESTDKVHNMIYPQTARSKNNYFAINSYKGLVRGKATPKRHKTSKASGKTTIKDSITPSSKENCTNSTKHESTGAKENVKKETKKSDLGIKTTRELSNEMILSLNTGRESLIQTNKKLTGTYINEEAFNENKRSMIRALDPTSNEITRRELKDILNTDLKSNNYKATNKRNASHGKARVSKSNALSKKSSRGNKQTKSRISTNRVVPKKKHIKNKATTSF